MKPLQVRRTESPPEQRPLMVYDGDCGFCRRWIERWRYSTGEHIDYAPYQEVAARFPEIPVEQFQQAVQLIEPSGEVYSAAEAVYRSLAGAGLKRWAYWLYRKAPAFAAFSEAAYTYVAGHRNLLSKWTHRLWGPDARPSSYFLTRWLFLRGLAVIYFIAFASLGVQVIGLIGKNGILPAADVMSQLNALKQEAGRGVYLEFPTLCWLGASDGFLKFLCWGGAAAALLAVGGLAPGPLLLVCWLFYLSLSVVDQVFLNFQWDAMLLEVGLLAIFFAPWRRPWPNLAKESRPSTAMVWLLRWLLFRLMFSAGMVKLLSGDEVWWNLTALEHHYFTQPLPTWTAWFAHQLPSWFQKASCFVMFVIELGAPFLIFLPRRPRIVSFFAIVGLMILILATGNYTYFNWLTIVLCVLLLDDGFLRRVFPKKAWERIAEGFPGRPSPWPKRIAIAAAAIVIFPLGGYVLARTLRVEIPGSERFARPVLRGVSAFRAVNGYGLFADMTETRPEIIIEGSDDGKTWKAYEFKWKPGDLSRRPRFVAPHQPRLDWQLWFSALQGFRHPYNRWFSIFLVRLLEGADDVLALLETNPFPDAPPQYIRAQQYDYTFTNFEERRDSGAWWKRELQGMYSPGVLNLRGRER